ncbi:MAG: glucokinase [Dongiaceae bacterium]
MTSASPRAQEIVLVGDIGGSTARFAVARLAGDGIRLEQVVSLRCAEFAGLAEAAEAFLGRLSGAPPSWAAIAIAGPVTGDRVGLTNHPWSFSVSETKSRLGLERLDVLNDFAAIALAVPVLGTAGVQQIGGGAPVRDCPLAVIGPGTGLGVAALVPSNGSWVSVDSEGGHATFAPMTEREDRIAKILRRRHGHVSWERILSGPGLVNLYTAIAEIDDFPPLALSPEQIVEQGLGGAGEPCREAVEIFCAALGTAAGNLALTIGARGGVFIGGGIVPRLGGSFGASDFRGRFENKGRMSSYLRAIPTYVIAAAYPGLIGAAASLRFRSREGTSP